MWVEGNVIRDYCCIAVSVQCYAGSVRMITNRIAGPTVTKRFGLQGNIGMTSLSARTICLYVQIYIGARPPDYSGMVCIGRRFRKKNCILNGRVRVTALLMVHTSYKWAFAFRELNIQTVFLFQRGIKGMKKRNCSCGKS